MLDGKISDLNNSPSSPFGGSITAALFLKRFVANTKAWAHFDVYAWNPKPRAYGPEGGEIPAARALFALIEERFGQGQSPAPKRRKAARP
jgi:leucyl aminopeptidase